LAGVRRQLKLILFGYPIGCAGFASIFFALQQNEAKRDPFRTRFACSIENSVKFFCFFWLLLASKYQAKWENTGISEKESYRSKTKQSEIIMLYLGCIVAQ
jgi:hypothetical protein